MVTDTWTARDGAGHTTTDSVVFTVTSTPPPPPPAMLMGTSVPNGGLQLQHLPLHGGYTQWDAIRVYNFNDAVARFNTYAPKVICLTDASTALGSGTAGAAALRAFLETFYYGSGSSARQGCEIHFANGNEYGDKVAAGGGAVSQAAFADTVTRMYNVIHEASGGVRRYPKAAMGLDPTHYQEKNGLIAGSLMPVAPFLDFVAWSLYPPGRESTSADPTFNKPNTTASSTDGHLERCLQRTLAAKVAAGHDVWFEGWEIGIGDDPDDRDHRPYYAVHSMARWCYERAQALGLKIPLMCWWDQEVAATGAGNSQNIFSDEPAATNPSTATAWRNWRSLVPEYGGTKPANWPSAPKSTWPTGA